MDLEYLKKLALLMKEQDLSEITLREEGSEVRLRRGQREVATLAAPAFMPAGATHSGQGGGGMPGAAPEVPGTITINSPMVGTFYISPSPDADPFVGAGAIVDEDTTVAIVEAMKVMNEIKAEIKGEIVAVLAKDAQPVQFGTPLFRIRPF